MKHPFPNPRLGSRSKLTRAGHAATKWFLRAVMLGLPSWACTTPEPAHPPGRHALIVTIGKYLRSDLSPLPGTRHDKVSATQIAKAMGIPDENITTLSDESATENGILDALSALEQRVAPGDRVYIHFSGHGTRSWDAILNNCVEGFVAHDSTQSVKFTQPEFARILSPISRKTDKLFVVYDACHSGGLTAQKKRKRQLNVTSNTPTLTPKFGLPNDKCSSPTNVRTRNISVEESTLGTSLQDLIYVAAARADEISFDDDRKGGLATHSIRECMLGDAVDKNASATIDISEILACAQRKIDARLQGNEEYKSHHLVLQGNSQFIPVWFSSMSGRKSDIPFTAKAALDELHGQRSTKISLNVSINSTRLRIGKDAVELKIGSQQPGWVYLLSAGSDDSSLQLLFPNSKDQANRLEPSIPLQVPRQHWTLTARGPAGTSKLLVLMTQTPVNVFNSSLGEASAALTYLPNNPEVRAKVATAFINAPCTDIRTCRSGFGSVLFDVSEE